MNTIEVLLHVIIKEYPNLIVSADNKLIYLDIRDNLSQDHALITILDADTLAPIVRQRAIGIARDKFRHQIHLSQNNSLDQLRYHINQSIANFLIETNNNTVDGTWVSTDG